jgi:MFS superfamily sulfate permease-like transporter
MSEMNKAAAMEVPKDGLEGLQKHWRQDLAAGFILFLLALPLSVGIAIASGLPATAGILAAVVGGIVGSLLGGSYVTINGPAAGLIVIILAAVTELGGGNLAAGYKPALAAIVIAGLIQVVMGVLKLGGLGLAFPTSVIHGMMMSIGVIIFAKQSHVALGVAPQAKGIFGLIGEIPNSIYHMNPEIALIGGLSVVIVMLMNRVKTGWFKKIPGPLLAVLVGVALGAIFDIAHEHTVKFFMNVSTVGPKFLLNVPANIRDALVKPSFDMVGTGLFWRHAITIALVATIESILSAYAVDKLDRYGRISNLNRELWSKGICNTLCGAIGATPIIAEIVRSSANVSNGAKTRWSNFFHGIFLLAFVAMFPTLLHSIPMAALAGILVVVGYRLGDPKQLIKAYKTGWDQLLVMLATVAITLTTDLLIGVACGFVLEMALNLWRARSMKDLFVPNWTEERKAGQTTFRVTGSLVSTSFVRLRPSLVEHIGKEAVKVDLSKCTFVDHTVMEHLERLHEEGQVAGTPFTFDFSKEHVGMSEHPLAGRKLARG